MKTKQTIQQILEANEQQRKIFKRSLNDKSTDDDFSDDFHFNHIFKRNRAISEFKAKHRKLNPLEYSKPKAKKYVQWYNDDNEYNDKYDLLDRIYSSTDDFNRQKQKLI